MLSRPQWTEQQLVDHGAQLAAHLEAISNPRNSVMARATMTASIDWYDI